MSLYFLYIKMFPVFPYIVCKCPIIPIISLKIIKILKFMNFLLVKYDKISEFPGPVKTKAIISECKYYLMLPFAVFFIHITHGKYSFYVLL